MHWSVSLPDTCIRPSHFVATKCHHKICWRHDTTSLVAQHSSIDNDQEYNNVRSWSTQNKLFINTDKTKEIIFHRPAVRNHIIPPPLPGIERVKQATLLGIDVTDMLSTAAYVNRLLMQVNRRLYLLSLLQSSDLLRSSLHLLFNALVINKLTTLYPCMMNCRWQKQDWCYIKKGHATWTDTYCVWHWRSYWQVRSQTLSAGHSARSLSAPSSPC